MKRVFTALWMLAACLCVCLTALPGGRAEIAEWAEAQEAAQQQTEWAALQGMTLDTSVQAQNVTKECSIKVSEGDKDRLTNGSVGTGWSYRKEGAWIGVQFPEGVTAGALRFEFRFEPKGFELVEYGADKQPLRTRTLADTFPSIYTVMLLQPETRFVQLKMTAPDQVVVNLVAYSEGILPANVQTWFAPVEKADMMVFSTHQDDEVIFLGGTIPYSDVVCGRPTVTVYMTNCSRSRRREALECLWEMGSRHYPEFINLEDERVSSIDEGVKLWGGKDNILKEMVARIRRYKPEVIVTQDLNGEYGHNQHKIMARAMQPAIEAAADPGQYPDSYNQYGAWQVKKLYLHLYEENQIRMDWKTPQPALGGLTLLKVAQNGMEKHASQLKYYTVKDGGKYDNALFGLAVTTVGPDVEKNDFFENIPADASAGYENRLGAASADAFEGGEDTAGGFDEIEDDTETDFGLSSDEGLEDEASAEVIGAEDLASDMPTAGSFEPVASPTPQPEAPAETASEKGGAAGIALIAAGLAAAGGGAWFVSRRITANKRRHRRRIKSSGVRRTNSGSGTARRPSAQARGRHTRGGGR